MEALEAKMKKHNINLGPFSNSYSHEHALFASSFPSMQNLLLLLMFGLLILKHLIIWLMITPHFFLLMNVTPKRYMLVMVDILVL
jgi:hypothetical protein